MLQKIFVCPYLSTDSPVIQLFLCTKKPMKFINIFTNYNQKCGVRATDTCPQSQMQSDRHEVITFRVTVQFGGGLRCQDYMRSTFRYEGFVVSTMILKCQSPFSCCDHSFPKPYDPFKYNTYIPLKIATVTGKAMLHLQCFGMLVGFLSSMG